MPTNAQPGLATAVSEMLVPKSKVAEHEAPQSIPAGVDRTTPEPTFDTASAFLLGGGGPPSGPIPASETLVATVGAVPPPHPLAPISKDRTPAAQETRLNMMGPPVLVLVLS
ncbi:MAG: hypothetical protein NVSMB30_11120 [Hymenobacter sp.]